MALGTKDATIDRLENELSKSMPLAAELMKVKGELSSLKSEHEDLLMMLADSDQVNGD